MKHCALIGWLEQCVVIGQALQVCFKSNTPTTYSTSSCFFCICFV